MQYSAITQGVICCHCCGNTAAIKDEGKPCLRCGSKIYARKLHSLTYTWALLIASAIMLLPANLLPIMTF